MRLEASGENGVSKVQMGDIITKYYMEYAKSTITNRAFPYIDGFKPVTRRIMYTMHLLKATGTKTRKCARIVGDTMGRFHPHGDGSIYGALVNMTDVHELLNAPMIKGQGSFGKSWSVEHFVPAAMRYTEASLSTLAEKELFNGLNEDAVDMIDNFSVDEKEPRLLPVTFPNLIVNNTNGVAVGMSTYIPTYPLKNACEAVKAILGNEELTVNELADILGAPDFCTGGNIHISEAQKRSLVSNGTAKGVYLTGNCSVSKNQITIYELPFNTNVENFISELRELYKNGRDKSKKDGPNLNGVKAIDNTSGRDVKSKKKDNSKCSLKIELSLVKNANPEALMQTIRQYTSFSNPIAFYTKFVWWNEETQDFEYKECGIYELLRDYWIPWRMSCIKRVYTFRKNELEAERHLLSAWSGLIGHLDDIIAYVRSHSTADSKKYLMTRYHLDEEQAAYVLARRIASLSVDEIQKSIDKIKVIDEKIAEMLRVINNSTAIKMIIRDDMDRIIKNYGSDRRCNTFDLSLIENDKNEKRSKKETPVLNYTAWVAVTKNGGVKKIISEFDIPKVKEWANGQEVLDIIKCNNTDTLLAYTSNGYCIKVPVDRFENTKGMFKETIQSNLAAMYNDKDPDKYMDVDYGDIILIKAVRGDDYTGTFTILYSDGRGIIVPFNSVSGNRKRYRSIYPAFKPNVTGRLYDKDKFFVVTKNDCAGYLDITLLKEHAIRFGSVNFKLPRWKLEDSLRGFISTDKIPLLDVVDVERFNKPYCVKMRDDRDYILGIITERAGKKEGSSEAGSEAVVGSENAKGEEIVESDSNTSEDGYDF